MKNMKQKYCETNKDNVLQKMKTIIGNGGKIVCVVNVGNDYLIIYNK
jgi:hypothetical protein